MIAYIRCWQIALNAAAEQNGIHAFKFNTYIISVLVIFFLQINRKFPKLSELPVTQSTCINRIESVDETYLKKAIRQFFEFYGRSYDASKHLISINIGEWQERQSYDQQTDPRPEHRRFVSNVNVI